MSIDTRKIVIRRSDDYMGLSELFVEAGLENTEKTPEGLVGCLYAELPAAFAESAIESRTVPTGAAVLVGAGLPYNPESKPTLLGGAALVKVDGEYVLHDMAVREDVRGWGLGERLLAVAMTWFREMGAERVYLTAKVPEFYEAYGFRRRPDGERTAGSECEGCPQLGGDCKPVYMEKEITGKQVLFVDSCVSTHKSRTKTLASAWIHRYMEEHPDACLDVCVVDRTTCEELDRDSIWKRNDLIEQEDWADPMFDMARQFKAADEVVMAAPYWDCSFPAVLKTYIENLVVSGLTFKETEHGYVGLCPAEKLTYITTAGGPIGEMDLGYDYIRGVGRLLGVDSFAEHRVEMLDVFGMDVDALMAAGLKEIRG